MIGAHHYRSVVRNQVVREWGGVGGGKEYYGPGTCFSKALKTFSPEKPFIKIRSTHSVILICLHVKNV